MPLLNTPYTDVCREAIESIDVVELEAMSVDYYLRAGSGFMFAPLGSLTIRGEAEYAGLKVAHRPGDAADQRLVQELGVIDWIASNSPDVLNLVPSFMGCVALEGNDSPAAMLVEDASMGGQQPLLPMRASYDTRMAIYKSVAEFGDSSTVLDEDALNINLAFRAGERERLLDFTPPPIALRIGAARAIHKAHMSLVDENLEALTVTVSANSPLGLSLSRED